MPFSEIHIHIQKMSGKESGTIVDSPHQPRIWSHLIGTCVCTNVHTYSRPLCHREFETESATTGLLPLYTWMVECGLLTSGFGLAGILLPASKCNVCSVTQNIAWQTSVWRRVCLELIWGGSPSGATGGYTQEGIKSCSTAVVQSSQRCLQGSIICCLQATGKNGVTEDGFYLMCVLSVLYRLSWIGVLNVRLNVSFGVSGTLTSCPMSFPPLSVLSAHSFLWSLLLTLLAT